jgi:hypothetical protein
MAQFFLEGFQWPSVKRGDGAGDAGQLLRREAGRI